MITMGPGYDDLAPPVADSSFSDVSDLSLEADDANKGARRRGRRSRFLRSFRRILI